MQTPAMICIRGQLIKSPNASSSTLADICAADVNDGGIVGLRAGVWRDNHGTSA